MSKAENIYNKIRLFFLIGILAIILIIAITNGNKSNELNNENLKSISQTEAESLVKDFINEKYNIKKDKINLEIVETERHYKDKICQEIYVDNNIDNNNNETKLENVSKTIKCDYDPLDLYYNFKFINGEYLDFNYFVNHFSKQVYEIDNTIKISEGIIVGEFSKNGLNKLHTYGYSDKSLDFILNIHESSKFTSFSGTALKDVDGYKYVSPNLDFTLNLDKDGNLNIKTTKVENISHLSSKHIDGTYTPTISASLKNEIIENTSIQKEEQIEEEITENETNIIIPEISEPNNNYCETCSEDENNPNNIEKIEEELQEENIE